MDSRALRQARLSGLITGGRPLLVMLSGGADSTCLLDVVNRLGAEVAALHVNYGLRPEADADETHCRELCDRLGIDLAVEQVRLEPASGNLQARARDARYKLAERHAVADYAAAHTLSDQAETVLYRLVSSPGRAALLGMAARRGRLVRPLLEATRDDTREHCRTAGLEWCEDRSNLDRRFARTRIRHEVVPVLSELAPGAERTIALTAGHLRDEQEVLDGAVDRALEELGFAPELARLRALPRALARLVLRRLANGAALSPDDVESLLALGSRGGSAALDIGSGMRAVVEYGRIRFTLARASGPLPATTLVIPGSARFGSWLIEASADGAGQVALSADALGREVVIRSWRAGDRMRPAGLGGAKKLQDLFTDRKVPREVRAGVPVIDVHGEIAWVVGVAVDERFRAGAGERAVAMSAGPIERAASIGTAP